MKADISEIAGVLGCEASSGGTVEVLLTDSRSLMKPSVSLFFAIRTERGADGHDFMRELYDRGVRMFVAEYIPEEMKGATDATMLIVADTTEALLKTGAAFMKKGIERVAITGSRGKTTLKEWIFQLLEPLKVISRSPRSYNSRIGVPLSLWQTGDATELAIIEAGISKRGEMERLADCIEPTTVIFTNIGDAHSEGFSSDEEKAAEKAILAKGETVRRVVFNADNSLLKNALRDMPPSTERTEWSTKDRNAELFINPDYKTDHNGTTISYRYRGVDYGLKVPFVIAPYELENIGNALAFCLASGISPEKMEERFRHLSRINTRLNVTEGTNGCSVILDSYTSDLSSLLPAIDFMKRRMTGAQTSVLVMSDIMHEADAPDAAYAAIAETVRTSGISRFTGIGREMARHRQLFPENSTFFETTDEFLRHTSKSDFIDNIILLKGSPDYHFGKILEMLETRRHETVLEVNLDAIVANYNYFRGMVPHTTGMIAMVKAFGYGAGSYEIAKTLQDCGAAYLAVAVLDEAMALRNEGIRMPIMVMNPRAGSYRPMFSNEIEPVIYTPGMLADVISEANRDNSNNKDTNSNNLRDYPIHLKLDTGMHRMGLTAEELETVAEMINSQEAVKVKTVFSHLATADCLDLDDYTGQQIRKFEEMTGQLKRLLRHDFKRHLLNSAGIIRFGDYHYDYVRLGIGLYGANTLPPTLEKPLKTVSTLRTVIINIREREKGESIGYARKGMLDKKSRIATIPIGYADGMNRKFGNGNVSVFVNGKFAPTVGNICMDACMIDVTDIDCKEGDTVEIFGENAPLDRLSDFLETIPYEILTSVSPRVKRIYFRE